MRYLFFFLVLFLQVLYCSFANAYSCTAASTFTIQVPNLYYPATGSALDPIGSVYTASPKSVITCSDTSGINTQALKFRAHGFETGIIAIDGSQVFLANGVSNGVGYAIGADATCGQGGFVKPYTQYTMNLCTTTFSGTVTPKVQFYQTAYAPNITATSINKSYAGDVLVFINGIVAYSVPVYFEAFTVATQPCRVTTSSISVNMGNIEKRFFTEEGSTAGGEDFTISLSCTKATTVALQIDSAQGSPFKALGLIPLTGSGQEGVAKGVYIQLINNQKNQPVSIGSTVKLNNAAAGTYDISLKAQYFQLDSTVSAGSANGTATFTITYP